MGERRGMKALELWCRRVTKGYPGVKITNMSSSWRDGLGFCAIIHHFRPDLIDFDALKSDDVYKNNALAFETAETVLGIPALLDPQDMVDYEVPDRLSVLTYVSQYYQAFVGQTGTPRPPAPATSSSPAAESPEPVSPSTEKRAATSARQREPCSVCHLPVFLAERMLVERRLVHRTCFRCARCRSQLSTANYYVTEQDQFCCELCPDEEIAGGRVEKTPAVLQHEREVLAGPVGDPLGDQADEVLELRHSGDQSDAVLELRPPDPALPSGGDPGKPSSSESEDLSESSSDSESEDDQTESETNVAHGRASVTKVAQSADDSVANSATDVPHRETAATDVARRETIVSDAAHLETVAAADVARSETNAAGVARSEINVAHSETVVQTCDASVVPRDDNVSSVCVESSASVIVNNVDTSVVARVDNVAGETVVKDVEQGNQVEEEKKADKRLSLVQQRLQQFGSQDEKKKTEQRFPSPKPAPRPSLSTQKNETEIVVEESSDSLKQTPTETKQQQQEQVETEEREEVKPEEPPNPFEENESGTEVEPSPIPEVDTSIPAVNVIEPTPEKPPAATREYNPFEDEDDENVEETAEGEVEAEPKSEGEKLTEEVTREDYPDDLNPFGDDEPETQKVTEKSLNPFEEEGEEEEEGESTSPSTSEQNSPSKPTREVNPFEKPPRPPPPTLGRRPVTPRSGGASPVTPRRTQHPGMTEVQRWGSSGSLTSVTSSGGRKKRPAPPPPGSQGHTPKSPGSPASTSQGVSPVSSPSTLRKRHAPPPPPVSQSAAATQAQATPPPPAASEAETQPPRERSKAEKEQDNYSKMNIINKSTEGKWMRKKGPAPPRPRPTKRQVKTLPLKEIQTELHDINIKQLELERQGVELEKTIRQLTELEEKQQQKEVDSRVSYGLDVEDMILQLFELVNEKNVLFRRQAELMYMRRQHRLEEEHAQLEYEIRCLMMKSDALKTDTERDREQRLIDRLVSVVEQRNEIVTMLELERVREIQEDASIDFHLAERMGSAEPTPTKKEKKKKKKEKEKKQKDPEAKKKKKKSKAKDEDDDKDIDEKEHAASVEKKKSKKIRLKKLFS